MGRSHKITLNISKKRDIAILKRLAKHLNQAAGGLRAARARRKKIAKI